MGCRVLHSPGLTLLSSGYGRIGVAKLGEPRQEEGAVEQGREKIEDFMRRYGFEGTRVLRVLAVAVAMLLVLRMLRVLAVPVLIGAILIVGGWLLLDPGLPDPMPGLSDGPVVENGVAAIVACGEKRGFEVVRSAPEPRTGTWDVERRGDCNIYYHHPPDAYQREQRHQRAH